MIPQKIFQSRQTLNTDRISQNGSFYTNLKKTYQVFVNPYPEKKLLKFPKNKTVRKQTAMSTLMQTWQLIDQCSNNPQKFCIKPFEEANKTTMFNLKQSKRISKFGQYNPMSRSLDLKHPQPRTFEDIGIAKNKIRTPYEVQFKEDPILIGQNPRHISKCNQQIWKNERKQRDNGKQAKQTLSWKVNSCIKQQFYGKNSKINNGKVDKNQVKNRIVTQSSDYSKTLNYKRRS